MKDSTVENLFSRNLAFIGSNIVFLKRNLLSFLLSILIGIFLGTLFGTFLPFLRQFFIWDVLIIGFIILCSELANAITYSNIKYNKFNLPHLNWIKIGIFLGFFIDAFKVGS